MRESGTTAGCAWTHELHIVDTDGGERRGDGGSHVERWRARSGFPAHVVSEQRCHVIEIIGSELVTLGPNDGPDNGAFDNGPTSGECVVDRTHDACGQTSPTSVGNRDRPVIGDERDRRTVGSLYGDWHSSAVGAHRVGFRSLFGRWRHGLRVDYCSAMHLPDDGPRARPKNRTAPFGEFVFWRVDVEIAIGAIGDGDVND